MEIVSQIQLRAHGLPQFCYLCGEILDKARAVNRDHCPPKGLFNKPDRANFPLILLTHEECNNSWKEADELVAIVTDALHSRKKSLDPIHTDKLVANFASLGEIQAISVHNLPLYPMVARIVRGMHALLYKSYLPPNTRSKFHVPLPEANLLHKEVMPPLDQAFNFSKVMARAILSKTAALIRAYNGKFKYACTWERFDDGTPFCVICFDIYNFHFLSPEVTGFPKTFIGMYIPDEVPSNIVYASRLEVELAPDEVLDPLCLV